MENKLIKLSQKSLVLLKKCIKAHNPQLLSIFELDEDNVSSNEVLNELRDAICDELILNGFEGDKTTKYGDELEQLIDEIGRFIST